MAVSAPNAAVLFWPLRTSNPIISPFAKILNAILLIILLNVFIILGGATVSRLLYRRRFPSGSPEFISEPSDLPLFGSRRFFYDRWNYFRDLSRRTASGCWSYYVGVNQMVGLSGADGRLMIFQTRELNFEEGINLLFGFTSTKNSKGESFNDFFLRRIKGVMQTPHLTNVLPNLVVDVRAKYEAMIGTKQQAITDPFESIYGTIFKTTMRTVGCDEAAVDPRLEKSVIETLRVVEACTTPETIVFPWYPLFPSRIKRTFAFMKLYSIFCGFFKPGIIRKRIQSGEKHDDALQVYLNFGDNELDTFLLIVAALFSGQVNSGINASWTVIYLADNTDWQAKALEEVRAVANQYNTSETTPLVDKLKDIPLHAWENQFPLLDACLKETIRMQTIGVVCRKNQSSHPIPLSSSSSSKSAEVLPPGAYATYHLFDAHRDAAIYADPDAWDPDRYSEARAEHLKAPLAYLGWGAGRHVCAGMRFAKLENTIVVTHWLAMFRCELVDPATGQRARELPRMDTNASSAHKPLTPCRIRFWRREDGE